MHPDHAGVPASDGATAAERPADEMAAVNAAYRVLSDPGRRAVYDRSLDAGTAASGARPTAGESPTGTTGAPNPYAGLTSPSPARMPWKLMGWMFVLGAFVVLLGAVLIDPPSKPAPDGVLQPGSCVRIQINNVAREVDCPADPSSDDAAGVLLVDRVVTLDAVCPIGTSMYPDSQGLGSACVRPLDG